MRETQKKFRWPKTQWGKKVSNFKDKYDIPFKSLAAAADVNIASLHQVMIGKTPGYDIVEKVDKFIADYEATHTAGPTFSQFEGARPQ